jgi:cytochrome c oxidase subunit 1
MHEHAATPGFLATYVFSQDHKMIAKQYLFTGLFMALIGGALATAFRSQLAWPDQAVPLLGAIDPGRFNSMVTMHGTVMVFWVAMPILLGALGNFLIPLMIGAPDMAFPRLNMASYWTFLTSSIVLVSSFFVEGGAAAGGWTAYPPLSARMGYTGVGLGFDLWVLALALEFASMLMGGVNYLTTAINLRAPGMKLFDMPIMVWMQLTAAVLFMFSVGPLIAGAVMLLLDHAVGTGFFVPESGGDPLLWQHLFWFFGHPEVYVILLPALGAVAEILPVFSRKPIFGYKTIIWSTIAAGLLSFVVWAHHQFISGIDPRLAAAFSVTTIIISVPFAVLLFSFIATLYRGSHTFSTAMLFGVGMLAEFLLGGVTGIFLGSAAADIYFHDTYFVVAHFHYTLFPAVIFGMMAAIYFWFPKMFGRHLNETAGKVHFWLTTLFFNLTFLPMFVMGLGGHHRRIYNPGHFPLLEKMQPLQVAATVGAIGLLAAQLPFIVNFFLSMRRGAVAARNPWRAATLEWTAPSPPGHGNFETVPVVCRGPYEYSVPGAAEDFLPQDAPSSSLAAPPATAPVSTTA